MLRSFSSGTSSILRLALLLSGIIALCIPLTSYMTFPAGAGGIFWGLLLWHDWPIAWIFIALLLFAVLARPFPLSRAWNAINWGERHLWAACTGIFVVLAALSWPVTGHVALSMDEYSVLLQSQIFASGHLAGHLPPDVLNRAVASFFRGSFIHVALARGDWASTYWPGCALLMAPFAAIGAPWAFNPAVTALSVGVMWRVSQRLFAGEPMPEDAARRGATWATLLLVCSPVMALNAWGYYSMPAHLLFNLLYCGALLGGNRRGAFLAGVLGGFALCLHNPFPHAMFALTFLVWVARFRRDLLLSLLLGYLVFFPFLYFGWSHFLHGFDAPTLSPVAITGQRLFKALPLVWPSLYILESRLAGLCKLWLWGVPALLVLAGSGWRAGRRSPEAVPPASLRAIPVLRLSGYALVLTLIGYSFVPFDQGHGWGFRYLHQLYFVFPWLAARFLIDERAQKFPRLGFQVALLCALSLAVLLPVRVWQTRSWIVAHQGQITEPPKGVAGIVFIHPDKGFYLVDMVQNDPFGRGPVWRLLSQTPAQDAAFARRYLTSAHLWKRNIGSETWIGDALSTTPLSTGPFSSSAK